MAKRNGADRLRSASEVIDALGGYHAVIEFTKTSPQVVSNWKKFNAFPARTYVRMQAKLAMVGKSAPASLWGMDEAAE